MTRIALSLLLLLSCTLLTAQVPPKGHPNTKKAGWQDLFATDLSNAIKPDNVWSFEKGVLTATEDINIWSGKEYQDFILDLEFKTDPGTNSGVVVQCTDVSNWVTNSIEIQITDDYSEEWSKAPATWQCGAMFGLLAPVKSQVVHKAGKWNRYTITCQGNKIWVMLNGKMVNEMDRSLWTSASKTPDGAEILSWIKDKPIAGMATKGHIGLQGKHAGVPVYFRNIRIREI